MNENEDENKNKNKNKNKNENNDRKDIASRDFTAVDGKLYSTSMVPAAGYTWQLTIDASQIEDEQIAAKLLSSFDGEMDGIGRTAAIATFKQVEDSRQDEVSADVVDIMLVTPAVLFDPIKGEAVTGDSAEKLYRDYFAKYLDAELVNFFARQSFAGQYPAVRRRPYGKAYYPFIQTNPGAVFRLQLTSEPAKKKLQEALRFGLPVADIGGAPATWKTCPFVPENGYGAICLHDPKATFHPKNAATIKWLDKGDLEFAEGI